VLSALLSILLLSAARRAFGLVEQRVCSVVEIECVDVALGLSARDLSLFVSFTAASSSSSSSFELLSSSWIFRLWPRSGLTTSVLIFPTAVCDSCCNWAILS
jgi:hypothetical protein